MSGLKDIPEEDLFLGFSAADPMEFEFLMGYVVDKIKDAHTGKLRRAGVNLAASLAGGVLLREYGARHEGTLRGAISHTAADLLGAKAVMDGANLGRALDVRDSFGAFLENIPVHLR